MLKNKRKQTYILFGVVCFAALSLATVGFSTWIVGTIEDKTDVTATITTEGSTNKTFTVDAIPSNSTITIDCASEVSNGIITSGSGSKKDMTIGMTYSIAASTNCTFNKIDLSVKVTNGSNTNNINIPTLLNTSKVDDSSTTDIFGRTISNDNYSSDLTYLSISSTEYINKDKLFDVDSTSLSGYNLYTYSDGAFAITFGSFFGGTTPEEFYNKKLSSLRSDYINETNNELKLTKRDKYLKALEAAKAELTNMSKILNGSTITISVVGLYTFNS